MLVPIKEMTDVLSVESKAVELSRDTWVRMKIGIYKGDLAKTIIIFSVAQIRVFADHVVESSEITTGVTRVGDYELHDLVLLE
ncbi:hypothetical protein BHM03_00016765 [Ensete ventricosum]|nr:hypothetical protein BHM03_00016765 [Ensete ventricosum]